MTQVMFGPKSNTTEIFDNKKATHREVAFFVSNSLRSVVGPVQQANMQLEQALSALYLYLAEVGICGVKITQEEVAAHYAKRLQEERAKQANAQQEKEQKEQDKTTPPCPSSDQSPDLS